MTEQVLIVLTLSIFLILTPTLQKNLCQTKMNTFLNTLKNDLNYGMHQSLTNFKVIKARFYPSENKYLIIDVYSHVYRENRYDSTLIMSSFITQNTINISYGHVNNSHYFYLSCGDLNYKINVYEKSGILNAIKQ